MEKVSIFFDEIVKFTNEYLKNDFEITTTTIKEQTNGQKITSCINIIGDYRIFLVFRFDIELCDYLFKLSTDGLEIEENEVEEFMEETVSNFINIVAGRVLGKFDSQKNVLLSVPLVLHEKSILEGDDDFTNFINILKTEHGNLVIKAYANKTNLVPRDIFAISMKAKDE